MRHSQKQLLCLAFTCGVVSGLTFSFEDIRLSTDAVSIPFLAFGDPTAVAAAAKCKVFPGDTAWPTEVEWTALNSTLGGVLLQPIPLGAVCHDVFLRRPSPANNATGPAATAAVPIPPSSHYNATQCAALTRGMARTRELIDDPLAVMTPWTQGDTCPVVGAGGRMGETAAAAGKGINCTLGGSPVYVVNASTVAHVQAAVNFARNRGLRLVVK